MSLPYCRHHSDRSLLLTFIGAAVMLLILPSFSSAAANKLAAPDRQHLLQAQDARLLTTMRQIPSEVVAACAAASSSKSFELADAGQPFQVTDVITNDKLLGRRLIWAAQIPGYFIVHYEKGGIAHSFHVLVLAYDGSKKARVIWSGMAPPSVAPLKSYGAFREALTSGKLDDTLNYDP